MDTITVQKLHTDEMIKAEVRDMLGAGKILLTLGMVEGLWLVDSPYVKGGKVEPEDVERAMDVCCVDKDIDPVEFHKSLTEAIETACRPYEIIVPDKKKPENPDAVDVGNSSEVPTFSPEWVADTISMACQAMPSLTVRQILWETPFVMVTHLSVSTARRNGAITQRPNDMKDAIEKLRELNRQKHGSK